MRFKFRLQTLLELRSRDRDEAGGAVGQANAAIAKVDEQIRSLEAERIALRRDEASLTGAARPLVDRLLHVGRYDLQLQADIQGLQQTRKQLEAELQRRQQLLTQHEIEVKRLEKLRDIALDDFRKREEKREQSEIDEVAGRRDRSRRFVYGD